MKNEFMLSSSMDIASTKVAGIKIITPATGLPVTLKPSTFSCDKAGVSVTLLEDYSFTNVSEVTLTPANRNRGLSTAARTVIKAYADITPQAGASSLTLEDVRIPVVANEIVMHGSWVLKPNTNYLLAISNQSGATAKVGYNIKLEE